MGKRGGRGADRRPARRDDGADTTVDRIIAALERWPDGMHDLGEPTIELPHSWPPAVVDVYLGMGGARLFGDAIVLTPAAEVEPAGADGLTLCGTFDDTPFWFDARGRIWREDPDTGDRYLDGTALDRWLLGAIEAAALLFDDDGEFAEAAFTDDGELSPETEVARAWAQVRRDGKAPGPRWRLARMLAASGDLDGARLELEEVVALEPALAWAWLDLARISEKLGELPGALDEARAAADADPTHEQRAYFFAEAARLAAAAGDEGERTRLAAHALAADPGLVRAHVAGADDQLAEGDLDAAGHLAGLARALAPRDLGVIDLARRIAEAQATREN
jgi:hypothetical protein